MHVCRHVAEQARVCVSVHMKGNKFQSEVRAEKRGGIRASMVPAFPKCFSLFNPFLRSLSQNPDTLTR